MGSYTAGRFCEFLKWAFVPIFYLQDVMYTYMDVGKGDLSGTEIACREYK